jgi:hypothetical protein
MNARILLLSHYDRLVYHQSSEEENYLLSGLISGYLMELFHEYTLRRIVRYDDGVKDKLEIIWKKILVSYFKILVASEFTAKGKVKLSLCLIN